LAVYIHLALYNTIDTTDTINGRVVVRLVGTDNRSVRWSHCPNHRIDNRLHIFAGNRDNITADDTSRTVRSFSGGIQ